jgi:hypothetical protein
MQDVERVAQIQALAQPGRARRARVQAEPLGVVLHAERLGRIGGHRGRGRDVGEQLAVRSPELQRAVGLSIDLVALLVHRAVMAATEQREVRERGRAPVRPMMEVMALPERQPTAREAAALVAVVERTPQCRAPTSTVRPSSSCRITIRLASHARRCDVSAETRAPPSSTDWPGCSGSASAAAST